MLIGIPCLEEPLMLTYRITPSVHRPQSLPYYTVGSAREWMRLAIAAVDEAAAALCRKQWQLAPIRVVTRESRDIAARAYAARFGSRFDRCSSWR
jgi:hypothetical protein